MTITLNYGTLYEKVARSLSIIGKRGKDSSGENLFSNITLSSAEKPIVCDFFANAFTEICATIGRFITAETRHVSSFIDAAHVSFWTDQDPATLVGTITADHQLLYRYDQRKLYEASLTFPFQARATSSGEVFRYGNSYYDYLLTEIAEPTDEQKRNAIALNYFGTDPQTLTATKTGLLAGYNGSVYQSVRQASFAEITPAATTIYYDPSGVAYRWQYGAMQVTPSGMDEEMELVVTVPDNWNDALTLSLRQSLNNYCVAYALYSWFAVTAPNLSQKYLSDTQRQISAALEIIHEKKAPDATQFDDPTGSVS